MCHPKEDYDILKQDYDRNKERFQDGLACGWLYKKISPICRYRQEAYFEESNKRMLIILEDLRETLAGGSIKEKATISD